MKTLNENKLKELALMYNSQGRRELAELLQNIAHVCLEEADEETECKHEDDKYTPELFPGTMESLDKITILKSAMPIIEERDRYKLALQKIADMYTNNHIAISMRCIANKALDNLNPNPL